MLNIYYKTREQESMLNQDRKNQENHTYRTMWGNTVESNAFRKLCGAMTWNYPPKKPSKQNSVSAFYLLDSKNILSDTQAENFEWTFNTSLSPVHLFPL